MNAELLLPKNKYDTSNIDKLKLISDIEFSHIADELLTWLQDASWPVFNKVCDIIIERQNEITKHISKILLNDDYIWQYNVLRYAVRQFSSENRMKLMSSINALTSINSTDEDCLLVKAEATRILNMK